MEKIEKKIREMLDQMSAEEIDQLLADGENQNLKLNKPDSESAERIKQSVYRKAALDRENAAFGAKENLDKEDREKPIEKRRGWKGRRALAVCAAALIVFIAGISTGTFGDAAAAIRGMLGLVPGYGIIDVEEAPVRYVIEEVSAQENEKGRLELLNAVATDNEITVLFKLERKDAEEEQLYKLKEEEWEKIHDDDEYTPQKPEVYLEVDGRRISSDHYSSAGGSLTEMCSFTFQLDPQLINTASTYGLELVDYGLTAEFMLKNYAAYNTLEEIGATEYHNNISITAVPELSDRELTIELYPINNSKFDIYSFMEEMDAPDRQKLYVETKSGIHEYIRPDSYGDGHSTFRFQIGEGDEDGNMSLHIPYIIVQTREEADVKMKIPQMGEVKEVNEVIRFSDSALVISQIELIEDESDPEERYLKMTLDYDNPRNNLTMIRTSFMKKDFWGKVDGIGYHYEIDGDGVMKEIYIALDDGEKAGDTIRLRLSNPLYYLEDAYDLLLDLPASN